MIVTVRREPRVDVGKATACSLRAAASCYFACSMIMSASWRLRWSAILHVSDFLCMFVFECSAEVVMVSHPAIPGKGHLAGPDHVRAPPDRRPYGADIHGGGDK